MKTIALLAIAALLAPAAMLAAHHADRRAWPALAAAVAILACLILAAHTAPSW